MKRTIKYLLFTIGALGCISLGCIIGGLWSEKKYNQLADLNTQIDTFGKTHFIVGYPRSTPPPLEDVDPQQPETPEPKCTINEVSGLLTCPNGNFEQALFSPDDNLESVLVSLIDSEQRSLKVAVFSFTNGAIAQALIRAVDRGVTLELVIDSSCLKDRFNKVELLQAKGITPHIYRPSAHTILSDIMHNKFVIFGENLNKKSLLWTGSFNFTKSAQLRNQENVIVLDEKYLIEKYEKQFEVIKTRIAQSAKPTIKQAHAKRVHKKRQEKTVIEEVAVG